MASAPDQQVDGAKGTTVTLAEAADLLRHADSVLVLTHRNPDADAVGAATALAGALATLGKEVEVVCPDILPESLLTIPGAARIGQTMNGRGHDLVVSVDVSDSALLFPLPAAQAGYLAGLHSLNLDHHVSNQRYACYNYIDSEAASAAEIIMALLAELGLAVDAVNATQMLYGIVNDTHSFQNSNTTARTLRTSADLVEAGADLSRITFELLLVRRPSAARLWATVLPSLSFVDDGRVAFLTVSQDALRTADATLQDADGLVEFLRSVRGVDLGVLLKETSSEYYRLSMRTSTAVDAVAVADVFGGGGHHRAAGCDVEGTPDEVRQRVLSAYTKARAAART